MSKIGRRNLQKRRSNFSRTFLDSSPRDIDVAGGYVNNYLPYFPNLKFV
jgi:hypothetical protein